MQNKKFKVVEESRTWDDFKVRFKSLMDSRGFNMKQTSEALNLNPTSISRYFQDRGPDILVLWRIADYFDTSIDWLVGRKPSKYETLSPKELEVIKKYSAATPSDKLVIDTLLEKYDI